MSFCDIGEEKSMKETHGVQLTNHLVIPAICFDAVDNPPAEGGP